MGYRHIGLPFRSYHNSTFQEGSRFALEYQQLSSWLLANSMRLAEWASKILCNGIALKWLRKKSSILRSRFFKESIFIFHFPSIMGTILRIWNGNAGSWKAISMDIIHPTDFIDNNFYPEMQQLHLEKIFINQPFNYFLR